MEEWEYGIVIKKLEVEEGKCNIVRIYNNVEMSKVADSLRKVCKETDTNDNLLVI